MASLRLKLKPNCNCAIVTIICTASYSYPVMLVLDPSPPGAAGAGAGATILACTGGCLVASPKIHIIAMFYGLKCSFVRFLVSVSIYGRLKDSALINTCRQLSMNSV